MHFNLFPLFSIYFHKFPKCLLDSSKNLIQTYKTKLILSQKLIIIQKFIKQHHNVTNITTPHRFPVTPTVSKPPTHTKETPTPHHRHPWALHNQPSSYSSPSNSASALQLLVAQDPVPHWATGTGAWKVKIKCIVTVSWRTDAICLYHCRSN